MKQYSQKPEKENKMFKADLAQSAKSTENKSKKQYYIKPCITILNVAYSC